MNFRRAWHGYLDKYPAHPDAVLSRLIQWNRGYKPNIATAAYPEPINLIAASAWKAKPIIQDYQHALIFLDEITNYWIIAIGTLDLSSSNLQTWMLEQFSLGACAVWTNSNALLPRQQPTYDSLDDEPGTTTHGSKDPITLTYRLKEMDKYRVGNIDLTELYPDKFKISAKRLTLLAEVDSQPKIRTKPLGPKLDGQGSGRSKCVYTPMGVFPSISAAAEPHDCSISKMHTLVAGPDPAYGYLSKEEYLRRVELNITETAQSVASGA